MDDPAYCYPLGTDTEWDFDQSLFALSTKGSEAAGSRSRADEQAFRIARAASMQLLATLESQHGLPAANMYRQNFRTIMKEVRDARARHA